MNINICGVVERPQAGSVKDPVAYSSLSARVFCLLFGAPWWPFLGQIISDYLSSGLDRKLSKVRK